MKKGIIICIAASLLAFTLTFLGLTMLNRMVAKEFENKSVEDVKEESLPIKQMVTIKPSNWLQETTEILVADPPLLSLELEQEEASGAVCDFVEMIKVRDLVYISTDTAVNILRCGVMDGEINSTVDPGVLPEKNDQSNFGTGFGYQIRSADIVDVYINGEWIMFTPADRQIYIDMEGKHKE